MPEIVSLTFRDQATGKINDLLMGEDKACAATQNLLAYLAGSLFDYKDEGVEFLPEILLCDSIKEKLQSFPGAVTHHVGEASFDPLSGKKILKDCAPLSSTNWFIFIERSGNRVKYGVFTYFRLPTAISLHDGISIGSVFSILIGKVSRTTVEIRGAKGSLLSLIFSTVREGGVDVGNVSKFTADCCGQQAAAAPDEFRRYFSRTLETELLASHGTILACMKAADLKGIPELSDAVEVTPALDFGATFSDYQQAGTAASILTLHRCEELLRGFLKCDGIIVFDSTARIIAYRVFYRPPQAPGPATENVTGGARRRAFEGLKTLVGTKLVSVLFRSQDGLTAYHGENQ
jgi:hypothetical protein